MRSKYGVEKLIPEGSKQKRKKIEGEILKKKKRQKAELILSETNILRNLGTKLMKPNSKDNVLKCVENGKIKITLCNEKQHRRNDLVSKKKKILSNLTTVKPTEVEDIPNIHSIIPKSTPKHNQ